MRRILLMSIFAIAGLLSLSAQAKETPVHIVEKMPEFKGGMSALMRYLGDSIRYPKECKENGIEGRSVVNFIVNTDGSISDAKITKSSGNKELDNEAVRVVNAMPNWYPATQNGISVRTNFTLPITFRAIKGDINKAKKEKKKSSKWASGNRASKKKKTKE